MQQHLPVPCHAHSATPAPSHPPALPCPAMHRGQGPGACGACRRGCHPAPRTHGPAAAVGGWGRRWRSPRTQPASAAPPHCTSGPPAPKPTPHPPQLLAASPSGHHLSGQGLLRLGSLRAWRRRRRLLTRARLARRPAPARAGAAHRAAARRGARPHRLLGRLPAVAHAAGRGRGGHRDPHRCRPAGAWLEGARWRACMPGRPGAEQGPLQARLVTCELPSPACTPSLTPWMVTGQAHALEFNLNRLGGVSFDKGWVRCMGRVKWGELAGWLLASARSAALPADPAHRCPLLPPAALHHTRPHPAAMWARSLCSVCTCWAPSASASCPSGSGRRAARAAWAQVRARAPPQRSLTTEKLLARAPHGCGTCSAHPPICMPTLEQCRWTSLAATSSMSPTPTRACALSARWAGRKQEGEAWGRPVTKPGAGLAAPVHRHNQAACTHPAPPPPQVHALSVAGGWGLARLRLKEAMAALCERSPLLIGDLEVGGCVGASRSLEACGVAGSCSQRPACLMLDVEQRQRGPACSRPALPALCRTPTAPTATCRPARGMLRCGPCAPPGGPTPGARRRGLSRSSSAAGPPEGSPWPFAGCLPLRPGVPVAPPHTRPQTNPSHSFYLFPRPSAPECVFTQAAQLVRLYVHG